jgi:hypothetical protein
MLVSRDSLTDDSILTVLLQHALIKGALEDVDKFCSLVKAGTLPGRAVLKVAA